MHRMQLFINQHRFDMAKEILRSWTPTSQSPSYMERRVQLHLRTAGLRARMSHDEQTQYIESLQEVIAEAKELGKSPAGGRGNEADWPTYTLGQLFCFAGRFSDCISLMEGQLKTLENLKFSFITSDYRILLCEALLRTRSFQKFDDEVIALQKDLQDPLQAGNPRIRIQLMTTKRLQARKFHMQGQWLKAEEGWWNVLRHRDFTEEDIAKRRFVKDYASGEAILSLSICFHNLRRYQEATAYRCIVEEDANLLTLPVEKIDYTRWLEQLKAEQAYIDRFRKFKFERRSRSASR